MDLARFKQAKTDCYFLVIVNANDRGVEILMNTSLASHDTTLNMDRQRHEFDSKICLLDYTVTESRGYLYSAFDCVRLGAVDVLRYHSPTLKGGRRCIQHIREDHADDFLFVLPLTVSILLSQSGRTVTLEPGTGSLLSTSRPFVGMCGTPLGNSYAEFLLRIPGALLRQSLPCVDECCARSISVRSGAGKVLFSLVEALIEERDNYSECQSIRFGTSLIDTLSIIVSETPEVSRSLQQQKPSAHAKIVERADSFIKSNLSNPALSPALIANHFGISTSYLHAAFSAHSLSVGALIREMRLQRCREAILNPLLRNHQSITQIALHWGFNSSSSFNHAYRRRFGKSPAKDRGEAISG